MVLGRLVWGAVQMLIMGLNGGSFPLSAFVAGAVTAAIPGIVLQLVLVPILVRALEKASVKAEYRLGNPTARAISPFFFLRKFSLEVFTVDFRRRRLS